MNWKILPGICVATFLFASLSGSAQKATSPKPVNINTQKAIRPKLVVGIVVDQMRWDYLYRYSDRYTDGGFNDC
jgi:hypothetical protein